MSRAFAFHFNKEGGRNCACGEELAYNGVQ